jgi:Domain of unknown function (DUF4388)
MTQTNAGEVPTASLVGSLAVFRLDDVLGLLSETGQRGELQVVGQGADGHLWIEGKDLVGASLEGTSTITQAVFELILLDEGWFYFTSDQAPPSGLGRPQSVSSVIGEVVPQVQEWRDLLKRVPLATEISLASTTPGPEIKIRADQWRVLTTIGTSGRTVGSIVDELEEDNVVVLRLIRELVDSGLLVVAGSQPAGGESHDVVDQHLDPAGSSVPPPPPGFVTASPSPAAGGITDVGNSSEDLPIVPPPVAADPWAPPGTRGTTSSTAPRRY